MRNTTIVCNLALIINMALFLASCSLTPEIEGSGVMVEDKRAVSSFQTIKASGSVDIEVEIAEKTECVVHADDNLAPLIQTRLEGNTLVVSNKERLKSDHRLVVRIKTPRLTQLAISGASDAALKGASEKHLVVSLSGAGSLTAENIMVDQLDLAISGAGDVKVAGKETQLRATISGAGELDGKHLCTKNSAVHISGAGDVNLSVQEKLQMVVNGAGDLTYYGNPQVDKKISGAGNVSQAAQSGACGS